MWKFSVCDTTMGSLPPPTARCCSHLLLLPHYCLQTYCRSYSSLDFNVFGILNLARLRCCSHNRNCMQPLTLFIALFLQHAKWLQASCTRGGSGDVRPHAAAWKSQRQGVQANRAAEREALWTVSHRPSLRGERGEGREGGRKAAKSVCVCESVTQKRSKSQKPN